MHNRVFVSVQSPDSIVSALSNLDNSPFLLSRNDFSNDSFSFHVRTKKRNRMYGSTHVSGCLKQTDNGYVIDYSIRPSIISIIIFLIFFLSFVSCFIASLFSSVPIVWFLISGGCSIVLFLIICGDIQICNARMIRKLHELENKQE